MLYQQLIRDKIVAKGKVVKPDQFQDCGLTFLVYDDYAEITVGLESIIDNVLIDDENFIRLIYNKVDSQFRSELPSEMRKNTIKNKNAFPAMFPKNYLMLCRNFWIPVYAKHQD